jgi:hypothetical protein
MEDPPRRERQRAVRSDVGRVDTTYRDAAAIRWLAEMYTARDDVLAVLLARLGEQDPRRQEVDRVGVPAVRRVVRRWVRGGYAERRRSLDRAWTLPTPAGYRLAGIEPKRIEDLPPDAVVMEPWHLRAHMLAHVHAVSVVRLFLEGQLAPGQRWVSERELRREDKARQKREHRERSTVHVPDGAIEGAEGERIAVEVELSLKGPVMFERAVRRRLPPGFQGARMFVTPRMVPILTARLDRMDLKEEKRPSIEPLPDLGIRYMED